MSATTFPLIEPIVSELAAKGVALTDKALVALNAAAHDAKVLQARKIGDDNMLLGLLQTSPFTHGLFESLGLDPKSVITLAQRFDADGRHAEYLRKRENKAFRRNLSKPFQGQAGVETTGFDRTRRSLVSDLGSEPTSRDLLLRTLTFPTVWRALRDSGSATVNSIRRHIARIEHFDPDVETQKFVLTEDDGKFALAAYDVVDGIAVEPEALASEGLVPARLSLVSPKFLELGEQIDEFEWLINKPNVLEYDLQRFFERHPRFLLGVEHKRLHSQVTLLRDDQSSLRPDFFLERVDGEFCDVLDIKLPQARLVVGAPNRRTFSASLVSALGQLREYRNYFDDSANRRLFQAKYGLMAYKPRVQVLIGRKHGFSDPFERAALQEELTHLNILTFDDILARIRHQHSIMLL